MPTQEAWNELIAETCALVKRAGDARGKIRVSSEVAALLETAAQATISPPPTTTPVNNAASVALDALAEEVSTCRKCSLCATRTQTVFGTGNPKADVVFVGEAPGAEEDRTGKPFVGLAGELLTTILVKGMGLTRDQVYICNVLKCRPPENRDPSPEEVFHCEPYLLRQLDLIKPKAICALGRIAAQTLLKTTESTGRLRGKWHEYHGIPLRVTYHPAYLLRKESEKPKTWVDIQEVMKLLGLKRPDRSA